MFSYTEMAFARFCTLLLPTEELEAIFLVLHGRIPKLPQLLLDLQAHCASRPGTHQSPMDEATVLTEHKARSHAQKMPPISFPLFHLFLRPHPETGVWLPLRPPEARLLGHPVPPWPGLAAVLHSHHRAGDALAPDLDARYRGSWRTCLPARSILGFSAPLGLGLRSDPDGSVGSSSKGHLFRRGSELANYDKPR